MTDFFLLFLDFVLDGELVFAAFDFGSDHQNIIECNDNRVVIIQTSRLFEFLGEEERVLLDHLVNHVFDHTEVQHDVVLSKPVTFLHLVKLPRGVIVDEGENLFDVQLDLVYFFDRSLIFNNILLIFTLRLLDFLLQLFLELLALVVFAETLIPILFNLVFTKLRHK